MQGLPKRRSTNAFFCTGDTPVSSTSLRDASQTGGTLPRAKTVHRTVFTAAYVAAALSSPAWDIKKADARMGICFFGTNVLIGLFEKAQCTNVSCASDILRFHPHPYGMRLKPEGLSHGLKKCPPDTSLPGLRPGRPFESRLGYQKSRCPHGHLLFWYARRDSNPRPTDS